MRFSASEAAFEGFRVTRHHPLALLAWTGLSLISLIAMALAAAPFLAPVMEELSRLFTGAGLTDAAQAQMRYASYATMPISLVSQAILLPAIYRAMADDGRDRFGYLRLGADELRVLGALVISTLVSLFVSQLGEQAAAATGVLIGALLSLVFAMIGLFVAVRLSLFAPRVFDEKRIDVGAGIAASKGVFWPLLGMAVICGLMAVVVMLLIAIVGLPFYGALGRDGSATPADLASVVAVMLLLAFGMTLVVVLVTAPFMSAYRQLKAGQVTPSSAP